jgi:hypothetical protein
MALGRDHQQDGGVVARPLLDLGEQPRRRLCAIGDHEQSPSGGFGHGPMQAAPGATHHPNGMTCLPMIIRIG